MLITLSPAKSLDLETPLPALETSLPRYQETAVKLARVAARKGAAGLQKLMGISAPLAALNDARFKAFDPAPEGGRPAIFTFAGDVYAGLDAASMDADTLARAQRRLRILSGLYGVLRPLDLIQPYRLEMGTGLGLGRANSLYATWAGRIAEALDEDQPDGPPLIVNLASQEYWRAVNRDVLKSPVITIDFRDSRQDRLRFNSFIAKRARGRAARLLLESGATHPDALKEMDVLGHRFAPEHSTAESWLFVRTPD
jgi:cytoplasmic iron level regulating protein YaaA (DUF328/UPF0246 family)